MSESKTEECEKLSKHTQEWNALYDFMEWLQEKRIILARYQTEKEAREAGQMFQDGSVWVREHPFPISKSIAFLLYEYFDVDPVKLETERRAFLAKLSSRKSGE